MKPPSHRASGLQPLFVRDFRLLLAGFALGQMLMPLQFVTQILWVQQHAPQDIWLILVALIGASRGVGALTFGLYGGALADRFDRRKLLLVTQTLLLLTTLAIAALMLLDTASVTGFVLFFSASLLAAGLQSIDAPTRLALVPDILGPEQTPAGMSLNQVAGQLAMPIAMTGSGFLIHVGGFGGAYLATAAGHVAVIVCIVLMSPAASSALPTRHGSYGFARALTDIRYGLAYTRRHRVVLGIILLIITMMAFGFPATANLGPTWITTVVGVEIRDIGFIVMTWGVGSLVAALALTRFHTVERRGALLGAGVVLFSVSFVVFVIDDTVLNVVIGNLGLGAGMTITMVSSTILVQHLVPNEVRGRVMSVLQLNMGLAQLMTMPVALLGQWLTLPVLFPALAIATLVAVVLILLARPDILRLRLGAPNRAL